MEFQDKFIGFVDILGFKGLVEAAENGSGMPLSQLLELLKTLGSPKDRDKFEKYGPTTCPGSKYVQRNLDFQITQITDCVIVSSEVSPAGVINLLSHCWGAVIKLLPKGIMCRGYITRGPVFHTENQIIGSAYQRAYTNEANVEVFKRNANERGTPFVEIDPIVSTYVKDSTDSCVEEMFNRFVKRDGDIAALFPFQRLSHSFGIGGMFGDFDPVKEKQTNQKMREIIISMKCRVMTFVDQNNPSAAQKAEHYTRVLDDQLVICNTTDEIIDKLCAPSVNITDRVKLD